MQIVRRITDENGCDFYSQFFTNFNKPQCVGKLIECRIVKNPTKENSLVNLQETLEDAAEGTKEHAQAWLALRKFTKYLKFRKQMLRVVAYEYDKQNKKYLTKLELV